MSSDLISRSTLITVIEEQKHKSKKLHELLFFDAVMAIIDNQPTAYNVDKVLEKLEQNSYQETQDDMNPFESPMVINSNNAINIVKSGGIK